MILTTRHGVTQQTSKLVWSKSSLCCYFFVHFSTHWYANGYLCPPFLPHPSCMMWQLQQLCTLYKNIAYKRFTVVLVLWQENPASHKPASICKLQQIQFFIGENSTLVMTLFSMNSLLQHRVLNVTLKCSCSPGVNMGKNKPFNFCKLQATFQATNTDLHTVFCSKFQNCSGQGLQGLQGLTIKSLWIQKLSFLFLYFLVETSQILVQTDQDRIYLFLFLFVVVLLFFFLEFCVYLCCQISPTSSTLYEY